ECEEIARRKNTGVGLSTATNAPPTICDRQCGAVCDAYADGHCAALRHELADGQLLEEGRDEDLQPYWDTEDRVDRVRHRNLVETFVRQLRSDESVRCVRGVLDGIVVEIPLVTQIWRVAAFGNDTECRIAEQL